MADPPSTPASGTDGEHPPRRTYDFACVVCGTQFQAHRRNARCCSKRCMNRLASRGVNAGGATAPDSLSSPLLPATVSDCAASTGHSEEVEERARTYALFRCLGPPEILTINARGLVVSGQLARLRLVDLLKTATDKGWLAYRRRPDGWYAAERNPERKTIALSGPHPLPQFGHSAAE